MTVMLGWNTLLTPLTREVFGEKGDRVLRGSVERYVGRDGSEGTCLQTSDALYISSMLFMQMRPMDNPDFGAGPHQIALEPRREVVLRKRDADASPQEIGQYVASASPIVLECIPLENVLELLDVIVAQQGHCALGEHCTGARGRVLYSGLSVLCSDLGGHYAYCGHCWDRIVAIPPPDDISDDEVRLFTVAKEQACMLDGRRIPTHTPVTIYAP